ncbi:MAG: hypothetical protein HY275_07705 [Gemmatimonadetes bacterium]|nr:hypothetical protein [Gemmatimonadota bacterium]
MSATHSLRPTRDELAEMARLALPLILVNVGLMLMGVIDMLMLGRVSGAALAAGALGNFAFWFVGTIGFGILMSVDPVVSQALGAGDHEAVARGVQRGMLLCGSVSPRRSSRDGARWNRPCAPGAPSRGTGSRSAAWRRWGCRSAWRSSSSSTRSASSP